MKNQNEIKSQIASLDEKATTLNSVKFTEMNKEQLEFLLSYSKEKSKLENELSILDQVSKQNELKKRLETACNDISGNYRINLLINNGKLNISISELKPKIKSIEILTKDNELKVFSNYAGIGEFLNWEQYDNHFSDLSNNNARYINPFTGNKSVIEGYRKFEVKSAKVIYSDNTYKEVTF